MTGGRASTKGEVRPLELTPWPRSRLQAIRGRREGRMGTHLSLSEGDQDVESG